MKKTYRKCAPKANSRPILSQSSHCMQGIFSQIRYFERELSKSFKGTLM